MTGLAINDLTVYYGPVRGVEGVRLHVDEGEIVTLLGANGAGKSTVLNSVCGLVRARSGTVTVLGESVSHLVSHKRVKHGVVLVPEGRHVLSNLTVMENLELGGYTVRIGRGERKARIEGVLERFPQLRPHLGKLAGMMSGGEQQLLAIARGMLTGPKVLLIDEPSLGLAPQMVDMVYDQLELIAASGIPVLLVEQNVSLGMGIAQRAYVLQGGSLVIEGPTERLKDDPRVAEAYLGGKVSSAPG